MSAPPNAERIAELRRELAYPYAADHHVNGKGRPWCSLNVGELRSLLNDAEQLVEAERLLREAKADLYFMTKSGRIASSPLAGRIPAFLSPATATEERQPCGMSHWGPRERQTSRGDDR